MKERWNDFKEKLKCWFLFHGLLFSGKKIFTITEDDSNVVLYLSIGEPSITHLFSTLLSLQISEYEKSVAESEKKAKKSSKSKKAIPAKKVTKKSSKK